MMHLDRLSRPRRALALILAAFAVPPAAAQAANPGTAATTTGQPLNVRIDAPASGASVGSGALAVSGIAGIGPLTGKGATNVLYVLDNSGSTSGAAGDCNGDGATDAGDDINGDTSNGTILDCEISGAAALNASLAGSGVQAGAIAFGSAPNQGDVSPTAGQQDFAAVAADASGNGRADVEDALRTINGSGFGQFTATTSTGGGTSFNAAITQITTAFAAKSGQRNIAMFLSDGGDAITEGTGSPIDAARSAGIRINTYSVGASAAGCGASSSLKKIADATGGSCTEVKDPTKLSAAFSGGAAAAGLQGVTLSVNGGAATGATVTALGTWSLSLPAGRLRSGSNRLTATATASDGTVAKAEITVTVGGGATYGTAVGLPSNKACVSKRLFPIRVRQIRGVTYDFATIVVNGRKVRVYVKSGKRWIRTGRPAGKVLNVRVFTAYVDLRGLVKGRYSVKIVVVATNGRVITGKRTYRTCSRRLTGTVPRL